MQLDEEVGAADEFGEAAGARRREAAFAGEAVWVAGGQAREERGGGREGGGALLGRGRGGFGVGVRGGREGGAGGGQGVLEDGGGGGVERAPRKAVAVGSGVEGRRGG